MCKAAAAVTSSCPNQVLALASAEKLDIIRCTTKRVQDASPNLAQGLHGLLSSNCKPSPLYAASTMKCKA